MNSEKKLKKEFTTYWSQQMVHVPIHHLTMTQARFFDEKFGGPPHTAILPDNIPFSELLGFAGQKTKVTIEIIP